MGELSNRELLIVNYHGSLVLISIEIVRGTITTFVNVESPAIGI